MRMVHELVFWGAFGMMLEICFTALRGLIFSSERNLIGHTSLWMFPIYAIGLTAGFDLIHTLVPHTVLRYLTYPLWIWLVEIVVGRFAVAREVRIWDYSYLPEYLHWRGIVSFAHYPVWVGFGILVEMVK